MKFPLNIFVILGVLCASALNAFCLDREAFSITKYDLNVLLEPEQQRIGVRGKIALRNDSSSPQSTIALQISSSLDWRSITLGEKRVQFVRQLYTSDIDHTGALSEALVSLPEPVQPHGAVELEIAYEGTIPQDATRLTRIGTPEDLARNSDWDQIGTAAIAVRGVGYVAWYPIATEAANLSDGDSLPKTIQRWKSRSAETEMAVTFESTQDLSIVCSGVPEPAPVRSADVGGSLGAFRFQNLGVNVPTFVLAAYKSLNVKENSHIYYLGGKQGAAESYASVMASLDPPLASQQPSSGLQIAELASPDASPFATQGMLLMPFQTDVTPQDRLTLVYALARQQIHSRRPWVLDGLSHYAQALDIERRQGRQAAVSYLNAHLSLLTRFEQEAPVSASPRSLLNMTDEIPMESKAMWVWWMLHDMLGSAESSAPISQALRGYNVADDTDSSNIEKRLEAASHRDLSWFFDDWVYHDRGLPDFKIDSVYPGSSSQGPYIVTITISNVGTAGAEVPVILRFSGGEMMKRVEVRAKSKAVIRMETSAEPLQVVVNNGSVPESNMANNVYKIEATE